MVLQRVSNLSSIIRWAFDKSVYILVVVCKAIPVLFVLYLKIDKKLATISEVKQPAFRFFEVVVESPPNQNKTIKRREQLFTIVSADLFIVFKIKRWFKFNFYVDKSKHMKNFSWLYFKDIQENELFFNAKNLSNKCKYFKKK
jgi:hypothetical protein